MLTSEFCRNFDSYLENNQISQLQELIATEYKGKDHNQENAFDGCDVIAKYANVEMISRLINKNEYSTRVQEVIGNLPTKLAFFGRNQSTIDKVNKKLSAKFLTGLNQSNRPDSQRPNSSIPANSSRELYNSKAGSGRLDQSKSN